MTAITPILAIDQGTTSSRAIVFNGKGKALHVARQEFPQQYPADGWVEHDPEVIWSSVLSVTRKVLSQTDQPPAAIGITNQRETTVIWNRASGQPICNAIVWQDRRTADVCEPCATRVTRQIFLRGADSCWIRIFQRARLPGCLIMWTAQERVPWPVILPLARSTLSCFGA